MAANTKKNPSEPSTSPPLERPRTAEERRRLLEGMPKAALPADFDVVKLLRKMRGNQ